MKTLRTKLIVAFVMVAVLPLGLLAYRHDRTTRATLIDEANRRLFAAASQTAASLEAFLRDSMNRVERAARLPRLARYMYLPPAQRSGSAAEADVALILRTLANRDPLYGVSYAVLDAQGADVLDTYAPDVGQDRSTRRYFRVPRDMGMSYASPVTFLPADPPKAALYFSAPVRHPGGTTVGVLRARYDATVLQHLVGHRNGLAGPQSFAMVLDEHHVRLAHGTAPDLVFTSMLPLAPTQMTGQPFFTVATYGAGDAVAQVAGVRLTMHPWVVAFAQPREVFLAPLQAARNSALFLAVVLAGGAVAVGWAMGQLLSRPITVLTRAANAFTAGDLQARAHLPLHDDIGVLATRFNAMAAQVGGLLQGLTHRTRALETEVTIRRQTEDALTQSVAQYRTLFEQASDGIVVSDLQGNFLEVNSSACRMLGYTPAELQQCTIVQLIPAEDLARDPLQFDELHSGQAIIKERRVKRQDGALLPVEVSAKMLPDGRLQSMIRDISKRKQSEAVLQQYAERLRTLHDIDHTILRAQTPEAIAQAALGHIRRLVPCQRASLALVDDATQHVCELAVEADAATGLAETIRVPCGDVGDLDALRQGNVHGSDDLLSLPQPSPLETLLLARGVCSHLLVPLIVQGDLLGFVSLGATAPGAFDAEHRLTTQQVAAQLAIAIHQARLHAQIQRYASELEQRVADRTHELSALYAVAAVASQPLDLQTTLDRVLERVLAAMPSDAGMIQLRDAADERLAIATHCGVSADDVSRIASLPAGQGLGDWVLAHSTPGMAPDLTADPRALAPCRGDLDRVLGMPMWARGRVVGVLSVRRSEAQPSFSTAEVAQLAAIAEHAGLVVESAQLQQQVEQAAVREERSRLARDLHDSVSQLLYSATLFAEAGQELAVARDLAGAAHHLGRIGEVVQQALQELRLLVHGLRPPVLEQLGLVRALQQRLDAVERRAGLDVRLLVQGMVALPAAVEDALYHIALESLNNALKHAQATAVRVQLRAVDAEVVLEIVDNGHGFAPTACCDAGGLGLLSMRERADRVGAVLTVQSAPATGTVVQVRVGTAGNV